MDKFFVCDVTPFLPLFVIVLACGSAIVYSISRFHSLQRCTSFDLILMMSEISILELVRSRFCQKYDPSISLCLHIFVVCFVQSRKLSHVHIYIYGGFSFVSL